MNSCNARYAGQVRLELDPNETPHRAVVRSFDENVLLGVGILEEARRAVLLPRGFRR